MIDTFKKTKLKLYLAATLLSISNSGYTKTIADAESCKNMSDCPYLFEMVSGDSDFKVAMNKFLNLPQTSKFSWIPEGTTTPSLPVILNDNTYILFITCQPHNCGDDGFVIAYQAKTNKLVGLHTFRESKKVIPINSPSEDEISMMTSFDNGELEKIGNKLPITYDKELFNKKKKDKEEENKGQEIIRAIVQRCEASMGEHGPSIVKGCVDNDLEALQELGAFLKKANEEQKEIITNCTIKMKEHGWSIVKGCVENDLEAQQILDQLKK
jgi:hypothetical protein